MKMEARNECSMNSRTSGERSKFVSDVIWSAVFQITAALANLIILSVFAKYYTPEIYGVWVQVTVTLALLAPILSLHLGTAIIRFLAGEQGRVKRQQAFSAMLWPVLAFAGLAFLISLVLQQTLSAYLFGDIKYGSLIPLVFFWVFLDTVLWFSLSYLQARRKISKLSVIRITFAVGRIVLVIVLARAGYGLKGIIVYQVALEAMVVAGIFALIIREIGFPRLDSTGLKGFLVFSLPQIPSGILYWVISASDRYFITHLLNLSQAGIYSAYYTLASTISFLFSPITFVLFPMLSKLWEQKQPQRVKAYLEYSTKIFLALAIPGTAGLYALSQPLLSILTTSEFLAEGEIVLLVALAMILAGIYYINLYIIYLVQQTKWIPLTIGVAAVTNAGLNIVLIPMVGVIGAAISTIVSYFILTVVVSIWASRSIRYQIDLKFLTKVILAAAVMAVCLDFIKIGGIGGIIVMVIIGFIIYALGLWLLRAFSADDRKLVKEIITDLKAGASGLGTDIRHGDQPQSGN